jgi:hypothetical protein
MAGIQQGVRAQHSILGPSDETCAGSRLLSPALEKRLLGRHDDLWRRQWEGPALRISGSVAGLQLERGDADGKVEALLGAD